MTMFPPPPAAENAEDAGADQANPIDATELLQQLRRKEGSWVQWADACQALQKTGFSTQQIFEDTGFEPIQQNQIMVAGQVYHSMVVAGVSETVRSHFTQRGSESLYELRVLSQTDRARAAELIVAHELEPEQVREIAKALKEYSYRSAPPTGFSDTAEDAAAYYYWDLARQQSDLPARSRLIAQGLRFAKTQGARQAIEKLLTDFTVVKAKQAPRLPFFRLETEVDLPCIIPVAGEWPLSTADFKAVPLTLPEAPFGIVKFAGTAAWVSIPGWQVVLQAEDAIALLAPLNALPNVPLDMSPESVLIIVDRAQRQWQESSYFIYDREGQLEIQWFDAEPPALLGRVLVVVRPKRILDEDYTRELWQLDE